MSIDQLWAWFYQRDVILIVFMLGPLTALGMYAAHQWHELDRFIGQHPDIAARLKAWRLMPKPNECPTHHILVLPRQSCPACGWKPGK